MTESAAAISLPRREKLALFALALAARGAAAALLAARVPRFGDSAAYIRAAEALWKTGTYPAWTDLAIFRPPGYPAFLALSTWGHPAWIVGDRAANAVLGALAALVLASIAGRVAQSLPAARIAGFAAAVYPPFLVLGVDPQSEPLCLVLLLVAGFLLLVSVDRPSSGCALFAGGALALAALTRPSVLPLGILLAAPLFDRRFPFAVRRALAASALFGFGVVLLPWTVRNAVRFHAVLPVSDGGAFVFWQGNSPSAEAYYRARSRAETDEWVGEFGRDLARWPAEIPGAGSPNPAVRARAFTRAAVAWIGAHPREEAELLLRKTVDWFRPWVDPRFHSRALVFLSSAAYPALAAAAAAGWLFSARRGLAAASAAILVLTAIVHVSTIVAIRYRIVFWDPALLVYAASAAAVPFRARP
ncbi:MAG TPA: hypothetical protein VFS34_00855 [Thermoanaerobaculia bacterium]|nr:hypothetical protein [Thermoanaerobaculia bacterium]